MPDPTDAPFGSVWTYQGNGPFMIVSAKEPRSHGALHDVMFLRSGHVLEMAGLSDDPAKRLPGYNRVDIEGDEE